jgi:cobalt/nickel transport system permease protein
VVCAVVARTNPDAGSSRSGRLIAKLSQLRKMSTNTQVAARLDGAAPRTSSGLEWSMHIPDGFLDAPTSVATGAVAAVGVAVALRKAGDELDEKTAPMAGLVAAFIFAVQMLNFPVGAGTSGHLLGGALAAVLVGPWTAILCMSVVLLTQSLLFADGGITALGSNITLMGIVTVIVGWLVFKAVTRLGPSSTKAVAVGAFLAALVSVPVASVAFVGLYEVGGTADIPLGSLIAAMVSWHVLIGIGEAVITGLTVSSVLAVRPDLVHGARHLLAKRELTIRSDRPSEVAP